MSYTTREIAVNSIIQSRISDQTLPAYHPNLADIASIDASASPGQVLAINGSGTGIVNTASAPNASTADSFSVARSISLSGDVAATSAAWDGSSDLNLTTTLAETGVGAGTYSRVTVDAKGRIVTGTNPVITGEEGQIAVTGGDWSVDPVIGLAENTVLPGSEAILIPAGTDAERPVAPQLGMQRYNLTEQQFEFYQNGLWLPYVPALGGGGSSRSSISDNIDSQSGTAIIPFTDTAPLITDGAELFSVTLNPSTELSRFTVSVNFTVDASANQSRLAAALFRDTVCISTVAMTTSQSGKLSIFSILVTDEPGTRNPVTYSLRFGGESSMTWYINSSVSPLFGGTLSGNGWRISELS